jgi:hypothetical protein
MMAVLSDARYIRCKCSRLSVEFFCNDIVSDAFI